MRFALLTMPCLLILSAAGLADPPQAADPAGANPAPPAENLYWPGDFEKHLFGGCYSGNANVKLTANANHTPQGKQVWELPSRTYQHLELLVAGQASYRMSFWAKTPHALTMKLKVISPGQPAPEGEKPKNVSKDYDIALKPGDQWRKYTLSFRTTAPYPGPIVGEILLTCYNHGETSVFIDDLSIVPTSESAIVAERRKIPTTPTQAIVNGDFEAGAAGWAVWGSNKPIDDRAVIESKDKLWKGKALVLGKPGSSKAFASSAVGVVHEPRMAGRRIRISADVGYLSNDLPHKSWAGVLFVAHAGGIATGEVLTPDPSPFWCPIGLSPEPGKMKRVSAIYVIPKGLEDIMLRIQMQPNAGDNPAVVDNLRLDLLEQDE